MSPTIMTDRLTDTCYPAPHTDCTYCSSPAGVALCSAWSCPQELQWPPWSLEPSLPGKAFLQIPACYPAPTPTTRPRSLDSYVGSLFLCWRPVCHIIWCTEGPHGETTQGSLPSPGSSTSLPHTPCLSSHGLCTPPPPQPFHDLCGSGKAIRPRRLLQWLSLSQLALRMMPG